MGTQTTRREWGGGGGGRGGGGGDGSLGGGGELYVKPVPNWANICFANVVRAILRT